MPGAVLNRPDVLVLGAGGILGEAWMAGVLGGLSAGTGADYRRCEHIVGTSAGSIVAARLAAGLAPRQPQNGRDAESENGTAVMPAAVGGVPLGLLRRAGRWSTAAVSPLAPLVLTAGRPGASLARAALLSRVRTPRRNLAGLAQEMADSGARFDGRLRVAAVDRGTGRRVVFGAPGAPTATVGQAVQASCSIPWVYSPVCIAGREYVDGGVWSPTNLDVAPAGRGTHVLCLCPMGGLPADPRSVPGLIRTLARSALAVETLALKRRGTVVTTITPDSAAAAVMGGDYMDPEPGERVLAAGFRQGLALSRDGRLTASD